MLESSSASTHRPTSRAALPTPRSQEYAEPEYAECRVPLVETVKHLLTAPCRTRTLGPMETPRLVELIDAHKRAYGVSEAELARRIGSPAKICTCGAPME